MTSTAQIKTTLESKGYTLLDQVGYGLTAQCYRVNSEKYNQTFVVKILPKKNKDGSSRQEVLFRNEVSALSGVHAQNVVNLYEYFEDSSNFYLILEYCPTNVYLILQNSTQLDQKTLDQLINDIVNGLVVMHQNGIAHLDIKPQNILIDSYNRAKIIDFGFAEIVDEYRTYSHSCGTFAFMAPELIRKETFNPFKADIWSLGMTIYYIFRREFPRKLTAYEDFWKVVYEDAATIEKYGPVIQKCINTIPDERPDINQVKNILFQIHFKEIKSVGCSL